MATKVKIHAYKIDGTLYRIWEEGHIIFEDEKEIIVFLKRSKVHEFNKTWTIPTYLFWFFPKDKIFNALVTFEPNFHIYINLASVYLREKNIIKYIDYDLDLKWNPKVSSELKILDWNEFVEGWKTENYSDLLVEEVCNQVRYLQKLFDKKLHFFNYQKIKKMAKEMKKRKQI